MLITQFNLCYLHVYLLSGYFSKVQVVCICKLQCSTAGRCGKHGGLMLSGCVRLRIGRLSPGRGTALGSFARIFTLTLFTLPGVQKGTGEFTAGGNPVMD